MLKALECEPAIAEKDSPIKGKWLGNFNFSRLKLHIPESRTWRNG